MDDVTPGDCPLVFEGLDLSGTSPDPLEAQLSLQWGVGEGQVPIQQPGANQKEVVLGIERKPPWT